MLDIKCRLILIVLIVFSVSCKSQKKELTVIPIDLDSVQSVDVNNGKIVELETSDSSLLYEIASIDVIKSKLVIQTRDKSVVFDSNGRFLYNVGAKGDAPFEYKKFTGIFVRNDSIYLFDGLSKKVLCYDNTGRYLFSRSVDSNSDKLFPTQIFPISNSAFIVKNTFRGNFEKVPVLSVLDDNYKYVANIDGRFLNTGFTVADNFSLFGKNEVLYWETLNDTIFSVVNGESIVPKYFVDFKEHAIPFSVRKGKDVYDLIDYTNKPQNISRIATFIRNVYEDDKLVRFMFVYNHKIYYTKYDKVKKTTRVFCFEDMKHRLKPQPFVKYMNGKVYLSVTSEGNFEKNPSLVVFSDKYYN